jgi:hypothetical protein
MSNPARTIEGTVVFSNVETEDQYKGKPVGYNVVLLLDEQDASFLSDQGVAIKRYEDKPQRKFRTNSPPRVVNIEDDVITGEVPYGSKVRLAYVLGEPNPEYGVPTYLNAVRVLERAASAVPEEF